MRPLGHDSYSDNSCGILLEMVLIYDPTSKWALSLERISAHLKMCHQERSTKHMMVTVRKNCSRFEQQQRTIREIDFWEFLRAILLCKGTTAAEYTHTYICIYISVTNWQLRVRVDIKYPTSPWRRRRSICTYLRTTRCSHNPRSRKVY